MDTKKKKVNTSQLLRELFKAASPEKFLQQYEDDLDSTSLASHLQRLCQEKGILPADIIRKANLETSYGYQIFKGTRNPSRDVLLQIAFGFEMTINQAQTLLRYGKMSTLYPRVKRDAVIIYCLHHKMSLWDAQNLLIKMNLPIMGGKNG